MNTRQCRKDLFNRDPHCHWCGELTVEPVDPLQPNSATLDHLYSISDPRRTKKGRRRLGVSKRNDTLYVLACHRCNQERGKIQWALGKIRKRQATGTASGLSSTVE